MIEEFEFTHDDSDLTKNDEIAFWTILAFAIGSAIGLALILVWIVLSSIF